MCRTNKYGFPIRYVPRQKFVKGFQTGQIVKAIVTKGKKIGTYVGRIAVRSTGSSNISTQQSLVQGITHKYCHFIYHLTFIIYHSFGSRLETSPKLLLRGRERLETKMKDER